MPRFPKYGFSSQYYSSYKRPSSYNFTTHIPPAIEPVIPIQEVTPPPKSQKNPDPVWFDLFGIKLYFDDVLILSLLFFLYKEEVKDESLFLALVLLLIS